jgi:WD40 repeat protein
MSLKIFWDQVRSVKFSPDGMILAAAGTNQGTNSPITLWDVSPKK